MSTLSTGGLSCGGRGELRRQVRATGTGVLRCGWTRGGGTHGCADHCTGRSRDRCTGGGGLRPRHRRDPHGRVEPRVRQVRMDRRARPGRIDLQGPEPLRSGEVVDRGAGPRRRPAERVQLRHAVQGQPLHPLDLPVRGGWARRRSPSPSRRSRRRRSSRWPSACSSATARRSSRRAWPRRCRRSRPPPRLERAASAVGGQVVPDGPLEDAEGGLERRLGDDRPGAGGLPLLVHRRTSRRST